MTLILWLKYVSFDLSLEFGRIDLQIVFQVTFSAHYLNNHLHTLYTIWSIRSISYMSTRIQSFIQSNDIPTYQIPIEIPHNNHIHQFHTPYMTDLITQFHSQDMTL